MIFFIKCTIYKNKTQTIYMVMKIIWFYIIGGKNMISNSKDISGGIFRLAALIYNGEQYDVSKQTTIKKIIESIFLDANELKSIKETVDYCYTHYNLEILESDVDVIVKKNTTNFELKYIDEDNYKFKLSERRYKSLNKNQKLDLSKYIDDFIAEYRTTNVEADKETIYKFLYEIFTTNLNSYECFLENNHKLEKYSVDMAKYKEDEITLINNFLNYDNPEKDKAIFSIVSLALEYCLLTGNGKQLYSSGLSNKMFYLDTNMIYRAIGINGENRQELSLKFLKKCKEVKINVKISKYTNEEFNKSVTYNIKQLSKYKLEKVSSKFFQNYSIQTDLKLNNLYWQWCSGRVNKGLDLFQAYILSKYEELKNSYNIKVDYKGVKDETKDKIQDIIDETANSIGSYKTESSITSNRIDAQNIMLISNLRSTNGVSNKLLGTKHFLISTDQRLREWDYYMRNEGNIPIVFLPSQWLAIILRYFSATNDDYKSFVSFLNINKKTDLIPSDKLYAILDGIGELTSDIETQKYLAAEIIEKKAIDVSKIEDTEEIKSEVKGYAEHSLDKQISDAKRESAATQVENQQLKIKNEKMTANNARLRNDVVDIKVSKEMAKWEKQAVIYFIGLILCIYVLVCSFCFFNSNYNLVSKIFNKFSKYPSAITIIQWAQTVAVTVGIGYFIREINKRINKNSKFYKSKESEIRDKINGSYNTLQ